MTALVHELELNDFGLFEPNARLRTPEIRSLQGADGDNEINTHQRPNSVHLVIPAPTPRKPEGVSTCGCESVALLAQTVLKARREEH
jgi:hypothetical protein